MNLRVDERDALYWRMTFSQLHKIREGVMELFCYMSGMITDIIMNLCIIGC